VRCDRGVGAVRGGRAARGVRVEAGGLQLLERVGARGGHQVGGLQACRGAAAGVAYYGGRVFVSLPKWKGCTPATLASLPFDADFNETTSPKLNPYPNWSWHSRPENDCDGLTSVFRMRADQCGRLWVLDSGLTGIADGGKQVR